MGNKKNTYLIFILGFALRIAYLFLTDPIGTGTEDGVSRLIGADTWLRDGGGLPGLPGWLPLHGILIGLYVKLGIPILWAGRLLSFTFSLVLMTYGFKIAKKLYNPIVANYTLIFLAFLPWIVVNSTENMTEILFVTFLTIAFHYIISSKKKYAVFIIGICLACVNLIRFEGWIFTFTVIPLLMIYGFDKKSIFKYFGVASSTILIYILYSLLNTGYFAYGITQSDLYVATWGSDLMYDNWWQNFSSTFFHEPVYPFWLWVLFVVSIFISLYNKDSRIKSIAVFISLPLAAILIKLALGSLDFGWRYLATVLIFLLPLSAYGLSQLSKATSKYLILIPLLLVLMYGNVNKINYLQDYRNMSIEEGFVETADWFKNNASDSTMLLLDIGGHHNAGWALYSNLRNHQISNVDTMFIEVLSEPKYLEYIDMLENGEFDYALTRKDSYLYRYFGNDKSQVSDTVLFYDWYQVYKLK